MIIEELILRTKTVLYNPSDIFLLANTVWDKMAQEFAGFLGINLVFSTNFIVWPFLAGKNCSNNSALENSFLDYYINKKLFKYNKLISV